MDVKNLLTRLDNMGIISQEITLEYAINVAEKMLKSENNNTEKPQVLIKVEGGNIQMIYSTSENVGITVIDQDNIEAGQEELYELNDYGFNVVDIDYINNEIEIANEEIESNNEEM